MSKQLRELMLKLTKAQEEAAVLVNKSDVSKEDLQAKTEEIKTIKAKIAALGEAEFDEDEQEQPKDARKVGGEGSDGLKAKYDTKMFYNAITKKAKGEELEAAKAASREYFASLSESSDKDGGYTVPDDLTKEIIESIKVEESIRNLVRVESVKSKQGQRITRVGSPLKLYNTEEREEMQMLNNPQYGIIPYKVHKYAGMMDISNELLDDSFLNFISEIKQWLADSARETENEKLLYGEGDKDPIGLLYEGDEPYYKEMKITASTVIDIAYLRKIKNKLNSGYRRIAKWVMNTQAQELIAGIKDANGREILVPDPRQNDAFTLFGRPVEIYDSIKTEGGETVIMFGNFERAYRMFDRKAFEIKLTDVGAGAFETDTVKARGIERFDGQRIDPEALVIARGLKVLE